MQQSTTAEIARTMYVSERTVKAHLSAACDSLDMSRVQLARLVERADLGDLGTGPNPQGT